MRPVTEMYNKGAVLVYDKPMIHYPLMALHNMGCDRVTIVTNPHGIGDISQYVKDGEAFGMDAEYRIQAPGASFAKAIGSLSVEGVFPFMLGDCYYDPLPPPRETPTLFWHAYEFANQHSVWNPEINGIVEKPRGMNLGNRAVIAYFYDERLVEFAQSFTPQPGSPPMEIVDIHNFYRENGADMVEYEGFFSDLGTPDGLLRGALHEQERQANERNQAQ